MLLFLAICWSSAVCLHLPETACLLWMRMQPLACHAASLIGPFAT